MSAPLTGGPAFPTPGYVTPNGDFVYPVDGVSMRDVFARGAAVTIEPDGCIAEELAVAVMTTRPPDWFDDRSEALAWWFEAEARVRYMKADAMLAVRAEP